MFQESYRAEEGIASWKRKSAWVNLHPGKRYLTPDPVRVPPTNPGPQPRASPRPASFPPPIPPPLPVLRTDTDGSRLRSVSRPCGRTRCHGLAREFPPGRGRSSPGTAAATAAAVPGGDPGSPGSASASRGFGPGLGDGALTGLGVGGTEVMSGAYTGWSPINPIDTARHNQFHASLTTPHTPS